MDKHIALLFLVLNNDAQCVENLPCAAKSYLILWPCWMRVVRSASQPPGSHADKV